MELEVDKIVGWKYTAGKSRVFLAAYVMGLGSVLALSGDETRKGKL